MYVGLLFGNLTTVNQRLHVGMVHGAFDELAAVEVVNPRITSVGPVAITAGIDQKAATVLCGSSSEEMAVSLITKCASCTICISVAAASSVSGA